MKNRNILISGASIAGPALAHCLSQYGYNPTVVERAPALRDGGYAVDFRGAAHLSVLKRMGILGAIEQLATHMGAVSYVNAANKPLARMPADVFSGDVEILRGDLSHILYDASKDTTEYIFGDSIATLTETPDGVDVTFASGAARSFDLVVGADGLHSNVRTLVFGDDAQFLRYLGYYIAFFTTTNHLQLDHTGSYYSVPRKLAGIYSARNNSEAKVMFCFASPPLDYDYHDLKQQKQIVADTFASEAWEIPRLLQGMWEAPDFYFDSCSQIHLESWSKGRVTLLGDAGYCASQGGNSTGLAVVGAYILAGELNAANGDYGTAFARYEQEMRNYVQLNQQQAIEGRNFLVPDTRARIWFRNQILRMLPYMPWKGIIAQMASKTANAITLTDYAR